MFDKETRGRRCPCGTCGQVRNLKATLVPIILVHVLVPACAFRLCIPRRAGATNVVGEPEMGQRTMQTDCSNLPTMALAPTGSRGYGKSSRVRPRGHPTGLVAARAKPSRSCDQRKAHPPPGS